jgi:hypothetical protein
MNLTRSFKHDVVSCAKAVILMEIRSGFVAYEQLAHRLIHFQSETLVHLTCLSGSGRCIEVACFSEHKKFIKNSVPSNILDQSSNKASAIPGQTTRVLILACNFNSTH